MKKYILILSCGLLACSAAAMVRDDHRVKVKVVDDLSEIPVEFTSSITSFLTNDDPDFSQVFIAPDLMAVESESTSFPEIKGSKPVRKFDLVTHPRYCKHLLYIRDKC